MYVHHLISCRNLCIFLMFVYVYLYVITCDMSMYACKLLIRSIYNCTIVRIRLQCYLYKRGRGERPLNGPVCFFFVTNTKTFTNTKTLQKHYVLRDNFVVSM